MSKSMTVSELTAALVAALPTISEGSARAAIKAENIRSQKRIDEFAEAHREDTAEQLTSAYPVAESNGNGEKPTRKTGAKKTAKKAGTAAKKFERKGRGPRKAASPVKEGPRGFRFGRVWNESVKSGTGICLAPANINKLRKHAEAVGYRGSLDVDAVKLAAAIAANRKFDIDTGVVQAEE